MGATQKSIKEFAMIGFVLLAVLFGMQIMTFIFGSLSGADYLDDDSVAIINETFAYVNTTGYTIESASRVDYTGASATAVWANLSGITPYLIPSANYTLASATGILTNATIVADATGYNNATISYVYSRKTEAEMVSDEATNASLHAIGDYAGQSGTQFTTLGIAITLILLVAVFLFFWQAFMGKGKDKSGPGSFS